MMRPWYAPSLYGVDGGPERVKCHSKRLDSRGAACRVGSGWVESSVASLRIRLMVGDLVLNEGSAMMIIVDAMVREKAKHGYMVLGRCGPSAKFKTTIILLLF